MRKEMRALSVEEARGFLAEAQGSRYYPLFLLAITTGLRPSEYLGLKWMDLDLTKGTLSVQRTLERQSRTFENVKKPRSRRTVKLQEHVVAAL